MTSRLEIYKCLVCGNVVEIYDGADGQLFCCGEPMRQMLENTTDAAAEKHVPVVEKIVGGYKVKVGEIPHPMEETHYIQWIELVAGNEVYAKFLKPGQTAEALFMIETEAENVYAREHCNKHGLWKGQ